MLRGLKALLLSRVELRIGAVLLSLATLLFGALLFGAFMKDGAERAEPRGGALGRVVFRIGATSVNLFLRFFREPEPSARPVIDQRFQGRSGLDFAPPAEEGEQQERDGEAGYLIVARHRIGSRGVEIIDLNRRKIVHDWTPVPGNRLERFFVLPDGSLLTVAEGRVFRMDACSNVMWEQQWGAHHSFERDADGNFWSPWNVIPNTVPHKTPDFPEDGLIRFSPEGEVLSRISLWPALMRAGHSHLLYGNNEHPQTPWHMNDVEPVLRDGPFWRRGDLFVSLRNSSVVLLYRPATDEVIWLQAGPWLRQHDVDVVSDSEISVFSNNTFIDEDDNPRVLGANEVHVHDFATGETRSPWREAMRRHDVRTEYRGGAVVFGDGGVMLEEAEYGRVLMLSPDGERVWSYVNRASNGAVYRLRQSRWLDAEHGAGVARSIAALDCGAAMD